MFGTPLKRRSRGSAVDSSLNSIGYNESYTPGYNHEAKIANVDVSDNYEGPYNCDVVFSFDTTGSMRDVISSVRNNLVETVDRLFEEVEGIRIGIISHGDYCDTPTFLWKMNLSNDKEAIKKFIKKSNNTGGGDSEECYEYVLHLAQSMNWKSDVKVLVLIGDELPHNEGYSMPNKVQGFQNILHLDWKNETRKCKENKITVFSCHARTDFCKHAIPFYNHISKETNGFYFPLNELQSFNYYMVTICLRAADAAEDLQLLRERQEELGKMLADNTISENDRNHLRQESLELDYTIHATQEDGLFSERVLSTATNLRSVKKVRSRANEYINELRRTNPGFSTASATKFTRTISYDIPDENKETNVINDANINNNNDNDNEIYTQEY
jgi:hypothetical protein